MNVGILYGILFLAFLAIGCWNELRGCTCKDKPEILKPKFKRYGRKDR